MLALVSPYNSKFEAEAIPIELGGGAWAFVLPGNAEVNDSASKWPELAFGASIDVRSGDGPSEISGLGQMYGRNATIRCLQASKKTQVAGILCPTILFSSNLLDAKSFKISGMPMLERDHRDLSIDALTITITDEPVTRRVSSLLPWIETAEHLYKADRASYYDFMRSKPEYLTRIREPFLQ